MMNKKLKGVSLFSSIGIGDLMLPSDFEIVLANELLEDRCAFFQHTHPNAKVICGDIQDPDVFDQLVHESKKIGIDFVIATPPCQSMSNANRIRQDDDERADLILDTLAYIVETRPKFILIENVPGMTKTKIKRILIPDIVKRVLEPLGYEVKYEILNAEDYGIPQSRKRVFFLINRVGSWDFPKKSKKKITIKDAIDHLPSLESGEDSGIPWHYAREHRADHVLCLQHTPSGKSALENKKYYPKKPDGTRVKAFLTSYKRMDPNKPAATITMQNSTITSQNNVHYGRLRKDGTYSDARVLTIRELLILMTIPLNWSVPSWASDTFVREMIGEAVPPLLMKKLFNGIKLR